MADRLIETPTAARISGYSPRHFRRVALELKISPAPIPNPKHHPKFFWRYSDVEQIRIHRLETELKKLPRY